MNEIEKVNNFIQNKKIEMRTTGLIFNSQLKYEEWEKIGGKLKLCNRAIQWWIGDWINYGEKEYGEMYSQALDETDYEYESLRNAVWVVSRIELSRRRDNLSFSHHQEVAPLEPNDQDYWLNRAEKEHLTRRELREEIRKSKSIIDIPAPEGTFEVIVIDPPWPIEKIDGEVAPTQDVMNYHKWELEKIRNLEIPASDNCHIFLWTTQKYLPEAFEIIEYWNFKYILTFVWHKNGGFQHFELPQYNCEFILYARKGLPRFIDLKNFFTCFNADRTGHNKKPEEFYQILRRVTKGKRLDMFSRRSIEGFTTWGNGA